MDETIRIVVIDDHPLLREGVVSVLAGEPDFEVVGEGCSAADAIALVEGLLPDILLLDVSIPGGGLVAARAIAQSCPIVTVVMLTVAEDEQTVTTALQTGARGYILKGISGPDLIDTIKQLHRGESYISPHLAARLLAQMAPVGRVAVDQEPSSPLTAGEQQILARVVRGQSYDEICRELGLAEAMVKTTMTSVLQKLRARNRSGAGRAMGQA